MYIMCCTVSKSNILTANLSGLYIKSTDLLQKSQVHENNKICSKCNDRKSKLNCITLLVHECYIHNINVMLMRQYMLVRHSNWHEEVAIASLYETAYPSFNRSLWSIHTYKLFFLGYLNLLLSYSVFTVVLLCSRKLTRKTPAGNPQAILRSTHQKHPRSESLHWCVHYF